MSLHLYVFKGKYKFINGLNVKNQTVNCMFTRFNKNCFYNTQALI